MFNDNLDAFLHANWVFNNVGRNLPPGTVVGINKWHKNRGCEQYSLADLVYRPIFDGADTILIFKDGAKSVVTCQDADMPKYNRAVGVAMALIKAQCGSDHKAYAESLRILCKEE